VTLRDTIERAKLRREMILKGEIDPDSAQDREERRHMRSSVFAVLTRKDSFDKTSIHKRGDLTARNSPSQSMRMGNGLGPKSNSFTGGIESGELKGNSSSSGSGSGISCAISSVRAAAMGSRSNSFTAFLSASLHAASSEKGEKPKDEKKRNSFSAAISASLNASSDKSDKDKDNDKEKDKDNGKGDAGT